jgi:hypothetical protein
MRSTLKQALVTTYDFNAGWKIDDVCTPCSKYENPLALSVSWVTL